ncbi:MAG: hypothetical protein JW982_09185 [Spirochaetes bacterium]|nr:hypothetical protein [Spirochaetota bacterium]
MNIPRILHEADFTEMFKRTRFKTIIYGGHFSFGYFSNRYHLNHISPYRKFSLQAAVILICTAVKNSAELRPDKTAAYLKRTPKPA